MFRQNHRLYFHNLRHHQYHHHLYLSFRLEWAHHIHRYKWLPYRAHPFLHRFSHLVRLLRHLHFHRRIVQLKMIFLSLGWQSRHLFFQHFFMPFREKNSSKSEMHFGFIYLHQADLNILTKVNKLKCIWFSRVFFWKGINNAEKPNVYFVILSSKNCVFLGEISEKFCSF